MAIEASDSNPWTRPRGLREDLYRTVFQNVSRTLRLEIMADLSLTVPLHCPELIAPRNRDSKGSGRPEKLNPLYPTASVCQPRIQLPRNIIISIKVT